VTVIRFRSLLSYIQVECPRLSKGGTLARKSLNSRPFFLQTYDDDDLLESAIPSSPPSSSSSSYSGQRILNLTVIPHPTLSTEVSQSVTIHQNCCASVALILKNHFWPILVISARRLFSRHLTVLHRDFPSAASLTDDSSGAASFCLPKGFLPPFQSLQNSSALSAWENLPSAFYCTQKGQRYGGCNRFATWAEKSAKLGILVEADSGLVALQIFSLLRSP
jgi:hypothetical protein